MMPGTQELLGFLNMYHICIAMVLGFLLDLVLGDPETWPHPVRFIGGMIAGFERMLYPRRNIDEEKFWNGFMLAVAVPAICGTLTWLLLSAAYGFAWQAGLLLETVMCWQILSVKSLKDASMKVCRSLEAGQTEKARRNVSMIVGRDTAKLDQEGIVKAAVETVAENTSDGVTAPLFFLALGGPAAGWVYKAVNTMDSMIGYRNERYLFFGRAAARMDDVLNYLPSRIAAVLMIFAAGFCGFDGKNAARIWRRDRRNHKSPNSAQTESVCAGALGLRLAGPASYFGQVVEKPYIGDDVRRPEAEDIRRANRLLYGTAVLSLVLFLAARIIVTRIAGMLI